MRDEDEPEWGCDCEHPPGWHFTWQEAIGILTFIALMIVVVKLS